ncbi:MAG: hypothetical protein LUH63_10710 [Parabacteroides sp.]|nr:hypothetical protein [Parabacteroides sp.]
MTAQYSLFKNPGEAGKKGKPTLHARLVNQRIIRTEELAEYISDSCFSTADVKGMLEALKNRLTTGLKHGAIIELEGLGTFTVSMKCPALMEEKDIKPKHVQFNKVVFRCAKELRMELKYMEVERSEGGSRLKGLSTDKRKANILNYLQANETISSSSCRGLNGCSKYMALKDLGELREEGKIVRLGYRSNAQYGLAKQKESEAANGE